MTSLFQEHYTVTPTNLKAEAWTCRFFVQGTDTGFGGHAAPHMTKKLEFDNKTNEKQWLRTKPWAGSNVESLSPKMKHESVEKGHFNL